MPAIMGGLVAGLASLAQDSTYLNHSTGRLQLGWQVLAMLICIGIGIGGELDMSFKYAIPPSLAPSMTLRLKNHHQLTAAWP
jgi:hypothetical protein